MPQLLNGRWVEDEVAASEMRDGAFHREPTRFRRWITVDGGPVGPRLLTPELRETTVETLPAEAGRYRLYVAKICPWASRTLIWRALEGLEEAISVVVANPELGPDGWSFLDPDGRTRDEVEGIDHLHQLYVKSDPGYSGKVSVPALWDTRTKTIVNNESADIVRMLDTAFDAFAAHPVDLFPAEQRDAIEEWNGRIYDRLNNGVYRAGFAKTQTAYEAAFDDVFATLDALEAHLTTRRFLVAERPLEADWRLFVTLVRFDAAYYGLFKCNLRRIADYPALSGWLRDLHQQPGVAATVSIDHIKRGYWSIRHLNPSGIVPKGPALDLDAPHGREGLG
ncbi:MAG: glutathione S-transferase family protein [Hyphomicrobiales bacterium]|nr:glutathione S-transferase family protein [Hyphomicrobiales bacterium]